MASLQVLLGKQSGDLGTVEQSGVMGGKGGGGRKIGVVVAVWRS